jgi:hypothetical protein
MARMRRIAISGHRGLPSSTTDLVDEAIRSALAEHTPNVTGLSCLADGADQIFARAVTDLGAQAAAIRRMPFTESTSKAHMEASKTMIDEADELYAVWDGQPARGYGGTADVVAYAREYGTPVRVIWPHGAERD